MKYIFIILAILSFNTLFAQVKLSQVESDTVLYRIPVAHRTIAGQPGKYFMKYMGLEPLMDSLDLKGTQIDSMTFASDTLKLYTNEGIFKVEILAGGGSGTVTSVGLNTGTSGTDVNVTGSPITSSGSFTLNLPSSSASNRGLLTSADWTNFNNKFTLPSLTSGSVLFSNGTTIAQDNSNFFFNDGANQLGIGTSSPNTYIIDNHPGLAIYGATSARIGMGNSSGSWITYLNNNEYRIYNNNIGESFRILGSNGRMILPQYAGSGNRNIYVEPDGTFRASLLDAVDGVGTAGYMPRWFDSNTIENSGLYSNAANGQLFGIGTTAPNTYLNNNGLAIYNATSPSTALANPSGYYTTYLTGSSYRIYNSTFGDVMALTNTGRMGINKASPSTRLHIGGDVSIDTRTGTATQLMGNDGTGKLCNLSLGTGLTITSGTLNQDYGAFSVAATTGGSGLVGPLDGDPFLTFTAGSGMTITRSGTTGDNQTLTFASTGGTTNLSYSAKSGTDVTLESSTGADVILRDGVGTFVNRVSANVIKYDVDEIYGQLSNTAIIGSTTIDGVYRSVDFTVPDESFSSIIDAKTASDEIEVLVAGTYEIHYSLSYLVPSNRDVRWRIYKNTADIGYIGELTTYFTAGYPSKTFNVPLAANDKISLRFLGVNGVSGTIDINSPVLKVRRIK